jgi:hypothetical protein
MYVYMYNMYIRDVEKSMPKLREVIEGAKTNIY